MAAMQETRAVPLISSLADHPSHAVRWAVVQALGRLDPQAALQHLRQAVNDPHPHIRNAAQKTLARLEA